VSADGTSNEATAFLDGLAGRRLPAHG